MGGAGADFQVDRLQQRAALPIPVFLQAQDHFLKSNHRFVRAASAGGGKFEGKRCSRARRSTQKVNYIDLRTDSR